MKAFGLLGSSESLSTALVSDIEEFVCEMQKPMENVRGIDFSMLPPCSSILMQQIMRANCICSVWNNANERMPINFHPEKNGWILRDNKYTPNWYIGELTPPTMQDMLLAPEEENYSESDEDATSHCEEDNDFDDDSAFED
ncbi:hypothetical protein OUZ56_018975 [Daphnia magna]|uniref:Uncharacterized protein n=1 Tax=Daphnia magna TaxID=35525 RepID=A0ABQ9ZAA3_9CRUS|nr:hypothetical protein OUZ56_018975 [Daphnia magna]